MVLKNQNLSKISITTTWLVSIEIFKKGGKQLGEFYFHHECISFAFIHTMLTGSNLVSEEVNNFKAKNIVCYCLLKYTGAQD